MFSFILGMNGSSGKHRAERRTLEASNRTLKRDVAELEKHVERLTKVRSDRAEDLAQIKALNEENSGLESRITRLKTEIAKQAVELL